MANADRPILISIVSVLNIILGLVAVILGVLVLANVGGMITDLVDQAWQQIHEQFPDLSKDDVINALKLAGFPAVVAGLINVLIGVGMWLGWRIMWYIGLVVNILELLFGLATLIFGNFSAIISVIINGLIIYYLFRPGVKAFFNI